jgi:hypothetical protein
MIADAMGVGIGMAVGIPIGNLEIVRAVFPE